MHIDEKFEELKTSPNLPKHVGLIMDGNGRWAKGKGLPRVAGHNEGVNSVQEIVEVCGELGIEVLTIYTFSEENWKRPSWEVATLMQLLVTTINKQIERLVRQNVRIQTLGKLDKLPEIAQRAMRSAIKRTKDNTGLILNVALSYGGRQEITEAVRVLAQQAKNGQIDPEEINPESISQLMETAGQPDPDLIIRTGGEHRISNFLLWQIAYAEIFITKTAWPDFRKPEFTQAVWDFVHRERRYGMVSEQIQAKTALQLSNG
jgi:undecaprenyl diphosphate synthase